MREKREMCGLQPTYEFQQPVGQPLSLFIVNDDDEMNDDEANFGSSIRMKLLYVIGGVLT